MKVVPLEVKELDKGRGRGIVATEDITANSLLFLVEPDLAVLYSEYAAEYCARCFLEVKADSTAGATFRCVKCDQFVLCHRCHAELTSGKDAGHLHRHLLHIHEQYVCPWYNELPANVRAVGQPTDYIRFVLQYAGSVMEAGAQNVPSSSSAEALLLLDPNADSQSKENVEFSEHYAKNIILKTFGEKETNKEDCKQQTPPRMRVDGDALSRLLLITKNNSLGYPFSTDVTKGCPILGWSLQTTVCMLNHSCQPNAEIISAEGEVEKEGKTTDSELPKIAPYLNSRMELEPTNSSGIGKVSPSLAGCMGIRALRDIKKGEEVTISYFNLDADGYREDVRKRCRFLLEQYRFLCKCELCQRQRMAK